MNDLKVFRQSTTAEREMESLKEQVQALLK